MTTKVTTRAIILKRVPFGDADWIVTFFSRDVGRMSGIAKAARKSVRRFGSGLEPGAVTKLAYTVRGASDLVRLEESQVIFPTTGMMASLARIEAVSRALALALGFLKDHDAAQDKFDLMESFLGMAAHADPSESMRLGFELKWLSLAGYEPLLECCVCCGRLPQGDLAFSVEQGGVVCNSCRLEARGARSLTAAAREGMRALMERPFERKLGPAETQAIAALLEHYAVYILGHPISSGRIGYG